MRDDNIKIIGNKKNSSDSFILPYSIKYYKDSLYFVDRLAHALYKYDTFGNGKIIVREGKNKGQLSFPYDLIIDDDKIFVADSGNYRIQVFDLNGNYLYHFSGYGTDDDKFNDGGIFNGDGRSGNPQNIFFDTKGYINAIDIIESKIKVFDKSGNYIKSYKLDGVKGYGTAVVNSRNNLFITDTENNSLSCYDENRKLKWKVGNEGSGNSEFLIPWRVVYKNDVLYVSDIYNHRIQIFSNEGSYLGQFGQLGTKKNEVNYIFGFDFDEKGNIYLTDTWNHRVKIYTSDFDCSKIICNFDNDIFLRPSAVKLSKDESKFYIADYLNHSIVVCDIEGKVEKRIGNLGSGVGEFKYPNDVYVSEDGLLYVSDSKNFRVQVFSEDGEYVNSINSDENLNFIPSGIAVYKNKIYIADIKNSMIHEFSRDNLRYLRTILGKGCEIGEVLSENKTHFIRLNIYDDKLIIADTSNDRIQIFDLKTEKIIETITGISNPVRAEIISDDKILYVNRENHTIALKNRNSDKIDIIQSGIGNEDGKLLAPWDCTYSTRNNLLIIADSLNNRVKLLKNIKL